MISDLDRLFISGLVLRELLDQGVIGRSLERMPEGFAGGVRQWLLEEELISASEIEEFDRVVALELARPSAIDLSASPRPSDESSRLRQFSERTFEHARARIVDPLLCRILKIDLPPVEPEAGTLTGDNQYELRRVVGRGGLGEIWLAGEDALGREVAIKRIRPDRLASSEQRARFLREAKLAGKLQHPNIVPVYYFCDRSSANEPFFAMPLVEGRTFDAVIAEHYREPLPRDRIRFNRLIRYFLRVCEAIAYAHSKRIVHRDLKPSNVMIGKLEQVFVLDWGLAKEPGTVEPPTGSTAAGASHSDSTIETRLSDDGDSDGQTRGGAILGSPLYMAPEQAAGDTSRIDFRTDIYGLGAILYVILTGKPPHPKTVGRGMSEHLRSIMDKPVRPARELNPHCPRALEAIAAKALARLPAHRYQTTSELLDDLDRWQAGESVSARADSRRDRIVRFVRRYRSVTQGLAICLVILIASVLMYMTRSVLLESQLQEMTLQSEMKQLKALGELTGSNTRWLATSTTLAATDAPPLFQSTSDKGGAAPSDDELRKAARDWLSSRSYLFQHNDALAQVSIVDDKGNTLAWLTKKGEIPSLDEHHDETGRIPATVTLLRAAKDHSPRFTALGVLPPVRRRTNEEFQFRRVVAASYFLNPDGTPGNGAVVAEMALDVLYYGEGVDRPGGYLYLLDDQGVPLFDPYQNRSVNPLGPGKAEPYLESEIKAFIAADENPTDFAPFWNEHGPWVYIMHHCHPSFGKQQLDLYLIELHDRNELIAEAQRDNLGLLLFMLPALLVGVLAAFLISNWIARLEPGK